jgi:hypothetical protein
MQRHDLQNVFLLAAGQREPQREGAGHVVDGGKYIGFRFVRRGEHDSAYPG